MSALYPYDEEYGDHFQSGPYDSRSYHADKLISNYQRHCNDEAFMDRCRVFLIFKQIVGMDRIFERVCSSVENVKKYFAFLDQKQLAVKYQLWAFVLFYKEYARYDTSCLMEGAEEVFAGYLNALGEEMTKVFAGLPSEGRFFALHLLRKDAVKYKQEILSYAKDSSNLVARELFDILCAQKDWEEDIRTLLKAKKASEREAAIRVCCAGRRQRTAGCFLRRQSTAMRT